MHTDCASTQHSDRHVSAWKCLQQLFRVDPQTTPKRAVLVVCWIGISPLRNPRISLSCSDCAHTGLGSFQHIGQSVYHQLMVAVDYVPAIHKKSQSRSNLWISLFFITICGRIIQDDLLGYQSQMEICPDRLRPHRADRYNATSGQCVVIHLP